MTMTQECHDYLCNLVERYSRTEDGKWLNTIDWRSVPFDWDAGCNVENGILGKYMLGKIRLMDCRYLPSSILPTLIHELYHRWQWCKHPVYYLVGKLFRPLIEVPANIETEKADQFLATLSIADRDFPPKH